MAGVSRRAESKDSMNDARYKPGTQYLPSLRALCSWPRCSGIVALILTGLDDDQQPPLAHTARIAVHAGYAQSGGVWRPSRRRRPFKSAVTDNGYVGAGVTEARRFASEWRILSADVIEVIAACPRCHEDSVVRLADAPAYRSAEVSAWLTGVH